MKIGLDIDGTITAHPTFFAKLSAAHEVVIVTSRPDSPESRDSTECELREIGIKYGSLCMCSWDADTGTEIPEELEGPERLNYQKVLACKKERVEALFDDDPVVKSLMAKYLPIVPVFTP